MLTVAVLASGEGTTLQAILDADLPARVVLVGSDRPAAPALGRARAAGVPTVALRPRDFPSRDAFEAALAEAVDASGAALLCLAGYMRLLGPAFVARYRGRCLNVHPSLLPAFPGLDAPAQALAHGAKVSGCTVHFVDEGCDSGPIVLQAAVPVLRDDTPETLHARIREQERRLYPEAIALFAAGRLVIDGRRVQLVPPRSGGTNRD